MNHSSDSPGGFPFFFVTLVFLIIIGATFLGHYSGERKKASWKKLAEANGLTFVPGALFTSGYVVGNYRNHQLKLETIQKKHGKRSVTYTRLSLLANHQAGYLLPEDPSQQQAMLAALHRFTSPSFLYTLKGEVQIRPQPRQFLLEQREITQDLEYLQYLFDFLSDLADAYPLVVSLGGEAVPELQTAYKNKQAGLQPVITQLLQDIAEQTTGRLRYRLNYLLCPHCLVRFAAHPISLSWWKSITYYGCRTCGQSRNYLENVDQVIALLNSQMSAEKSQSGHVLQVNWSIRRALFDFDTVEIIQATDEEVERFALQVGNDTDPFRQRKYKQMVCTLAPACHLSENTVRILRRIFGQVNRTS